ncbi:hypothetical protein D3C84_1165140 [compost metagenome]
MCSADPEAAACRKVKFSTGGQFAGSAAGGMLGARIGLGASTTICAALGVSTGVGGVVCIAAVVGVGSLVGSSAVGAFGERTGEVVYEVTQP